MITRLNSVDLVGTTRRLSFEPGLNIITGPISSGKSTLVRLCRSLFGAHLENLPPEVRANVYAIGGSITLRQAEWTELRPLTTTRNAKIELAGGHGSVRLPYLERDRPGDRNFSDWLLENLGLPHLSVPSSPTRPDSEASALSINDFFLYCHLSQKEIDQSVFGHQDPFKNIKRKYVFEVVYGLYDAEVAVLQEQYRDVSSQLRMVQTELSTFGKVMADTPWENRAELERRLRDAEGDLLLLQQEARSLARGGTSTPEIQALQRQILSLDMSQAERQNVISKEIQNIAELDRLRNQLDSQAARLTKAIVADSYLNNIEFMVCPRCGSELTPTDSSETCYLCHNHPPVSIDKQHLVSEQERLFAQVDETNQLIQSRQEALKKLREEVNSEQNRRRRLGEELDFLQSSYVSDASSRLTEAATLRATAQNNVERLTDYLQLYKRLEQFAGDKAKLEAEKESLEAQLDDRSARKESAETAIKTLEEEFRNILMRLALPNFLNPENSFIDRETYLPLVDGRRFDTLSSPGLEIFINFAHAIAHHRTAIKLGLPLPNILFIDGLTSNIGKEGYDVDRVNRAYDYLVELSAELGNKLQVIVSDGLIPTQAEPFVRLRLSEDDRLVPKR